MQVGAFSELEPKPAWNRQQQNYGPANCESHWSRGQKRQPLPERHPKKHVSHQALRKLVFHLVSLDIVIQLRDFAERLGREEPDFSGVRIGDPDENHGNIRIPKEKNADSLHVGGAVLETAFGGGGEAAQFAHEGAVHEQLQFLGQFRSLRLAARGAHLQVIGSGLVISGLRGLQESKYGSRWRIAPQLIGGRGSWSLSLRRSTLQQLGHGLGCKRRGHQAE